MVSDVLLHRSHASVFLHSLGETLGNKPIRLIQKGRPCRRDVGGGLRPACGTAQVFSGRLDISAGLGGTALQVAEQDGGGISFTPIHNVKEFHPSFLEGHRLSG